MMNVNSFRAISGRVRILGKLHAGVSMRRIIVAVLMALFCYSTSSAEKVILDNEHIQKYRGRLGKWILIESKRALLINAKRFAISTRDVFAINTIKGINKVIGRYVFFPYSRVYLRYLTSKGISRTAIECPEELFIWPLKKVVRITSVLGTRWGRFHPGVDMPATRGTPICASMGGRVIFSGYAGGYGLTVEIEHRNNYVTKYAHNSALFVKRGDFVKKGQIIGLVGSTGNSTGPHLHFEIRSGDVPLDPLDFLPKNKDLEFAHPFKKWK